jgi:hypothetical protein
VGFIPSDYSGDNPTLPQVLLNRDNLVSLVTRALGALELDAVVTRMGGDPVEEIVAQVEGLSDLNLGKLITVFILLALLRIFASLDSRIDISLFWKSNLCEEGFSNSNCLIITVKFLIDLISLISSIARLRLIKRLGVDVASIWGEVSIEPRPCS